MIIRALDANHDWEFGKGAQNYNFGNNAIAENLQTRLLSWLNDCFFDMGAGVDWLNFLGSKNKQVEIVNSCRIITLQSEGVVKINNLSFSIVNRALTLAYNIDTIYTKNLSNSVEVINV